MTDNTRRPLPAQEVLRRLFDYDPISGLLTWRAHEGRDTSRNARWEGAPAGYLHSLGYWVVRTGGRRYLAHRLIWKWLHGTEPSSIDHVDSDGADNREVNLRACDHFENMRNTAGWSSKALPKGVHRRPESGRYRAIICVNRRNIGLGTFNTIEEAATAYAVAATIHHGSFARTS